jgi:hypothetical protein
MWNKFKDQLPLIVIMIGLIAGAAYWLHTRTLDELTRLQQAEITRLEIANQATADDTRRQIEGVNVLLRDAIERRSSDLFMNDEELAAVNEARIEELAGAIARQIQPFTPTPRTPDEAAEQEEAQLDRVSSGIAQRIEPILARMAADQNLSAESLADYSRTISDQISVVLTSELARNRQLSANLAESQVVAQESLGLSQELAALYLSSFRDQGVLTRLLTLPANVIRDASQLSIVNSSERRQKEEELMGRLAEIQRKLEAVHGPSEPSTNGGDGEP